MKQLVLIHSLLFLFSCDFSSRTSKDILLAQTYLAEEEYANAAKRYESSLNSRGLPEKVKTKILYQLGDLYSIHLNDIQKGISYYQKISKSTDDPLWLLRSQGRIAEIEFTHLKNYQESFRIYDSLKKFIPRLEKYDLYDYRSALSKFYLKDYINAEKILQNIVEQQGHQYFKESNFELGKVYFHQKKWELAIDTWRNYLRIEKNKNKIIETKFLIGNAYETMRNLKDAYKVYYGLIDSYPNKKVILNRLNAIYERRIARKR